MWNLFQQFNQQGNIIQNIRNPLNKHQKLIHSTIGKRTWYFSKEQQMENKNMCSILSYQANAHHEKLRFLLTLAIMTYHQEDRANLHWQRCRNIGQYSYSKVIKTKRGVSSKTKKRTTITVVSPLGLYMKDSKWAFRQVSAAHSWLSRHYSQ